MSSRECIESNRSVTGTPGRRWANAPLSGVFWFFSFLSKNKKAPNPKKGGFALPLEREIPQKKKKKKKKKKTDLDSTSLVVSL